MAHRAFAQLGDGLALIDKQHAFGNGAVLGHIVGINAQMVDFYFHLALILHSKRLNQSLIDLASPTGADVFNTRMLHLRHSSINASIDSN